MEAIKKKIAALKQEMDGANEKYEANEVKTKQENFRADKIYDEVRDLEKKLVQMEKDYEVSKVLLETQTAELERCEKAYAKAESDCTSMTKRVQDIETLLLKKEELRLSATTKLERATELKDDAGRMCKVLEERSKLDEERMEKLTAELKDAKLLAEDSDTKSDECVAKLSWVEEELESAEDRVKTSEAKVIEREDELFIVQNIVKSLVVSEEKANARVLDMKNQLKELKKKLKEAEKRAIIAERTVKKLLKEVDFKEDELREEKDKYRALCDDMDATFAELTGF